MSRPAYQLVDRPDELRIGVRFLAPAVAAVMLSVLALFFSLMFQVSGMPPGFLIMMALTGGYALFLAFYASWVSVKNGRLEFYSVPVGRRRTVDPAEIQEISCRMIRAPAGRGGWSERYALMATTKYGGHKPATLLYGFTKGDDAEAAGLALARRLNTLRAPGAAPVVFCVL